jgi:uncharacterized repeat protein (TIGR01451 family)
VGPGTASTGGSRRDAGRRACVAARALAAAAAAALTLLGSALALPVVRKTPSGPHVVSGGGEVTVPAGQHVDWLVSICNDTGSSLDATFLDQVHAFNCPPDQYLRLACPPLLDGGGTIDACDDAGDGLLSISGMSIPNLRCADIAFRTAVDLLTPPGTMIGNVGFYFTPVQSDQTTPPAASVPGCTRLRVLPPLPTALDMGLTLTPDAPPFVAGDTGSTVVLEVVATNLTPRRATGDLDVPLPAGLAFMEVVTCPPGVACGEAPPGTFRATGVVVEEGGSFVAAVRARGSCAGVSGASLCAQAGFVPLEDPSARLLSDADPSEAGAQPTCFEIEHAEPVLTKTYITDDLDGSGAPSPGDRVHFTITAWNRGHAAARDVEITDPVLFGFDVATVTVDEGGVYDVPSATARWTVDDLGPGSVRDVHLHATLTSGASACNRARLSTRVSRACGVPDVSSDNPLTAPFDSTCVVFSGAPAPRLTKSFSWQDDDADGYVTPGEPLAFLIEITNDGSGALVDGELIDTLPPCVESLLPGTVSIDPPGDGTDASSMRDVRVTALGGADGLGPGETVRVRVPSLAFSVAGCCNQAAVTWNGGAASVLSDDTRTPYTGMDPTCLAGTLEEAPELTKEVALLESDGDGVAEVGERLRYHVRVRNLGETELRDGLVADEIPAGLAVDPASVAVEPPGVDWWWLPPPRGLFGAGRLEMRRLYLRPLAVAELWFEATIGAAAAGATCNRATMTADRLYLPFDTPFQSPHLSEDLARRGPTCADVAPAAGPVVVVTLTLGGDLAQDCALPGEEGLLAVDYQNLGSAAATSASLVLSVPPQVSVFDAGGGAPGAGTVSWSLGTLAAGEAGRRTVRIGTLCTEPAGAALAFAVSLTSAESPPAAASVDVVLRVPEVSGSVSLTHDDTNANGQLSPGETVHARIDLTEAAGCDAAPLEVLLDLGTDLVATAAFDGGVVGPTGVTWALPVLGAGASRALSADLALRLGAPNCAAPTVRPEASWPRSPGTPCPGTSAWEPARTATPLADCTASGPADLLREAAVTDLGPPVAPELRGLLDEAGVDATCSGGTTRITADAGHVAAADVAARLAAGVVVARDGLPVASGGSSPFILYEVSRSCATIRACKVDDDGDAGNGRESVLVTTTPCGS